MQSFPPREHDLFYFDSKAKAFPVCHLSAQSNRFYTLRFGTSIIHFPNHLHKITWSLFQGTGGARQGTPWMGCQSIARHNHAHSHTHSHTMWEQVRDSSQPTAYVFILVKETGVHVGIWTPSNPQAWRYKTKFLLLSCVAGIFVLSLFSVRAFMQNNPHYFFFLIAFYRLCVFTITYVCI